MSDVAKRPICTLGTYGVFGNLSFTGDRAQRIVDGSRGTDQRNRFGLEDGLEHTQEVGRSFAVTRERIRQIEAKALCKLRQPARSRKLKSFLEDVHE